MATFATIRPRLPADFSFAVTFITAYTARRELDMQKPNMYVKKAREKKEKVEKGKKITVTSQQLALLQKLGLA
jgi:hypothetical protein